jgi:hypothetical protein
MFDFLIKLQVSLFGNFDSITPTPKIIQEIFDLYKEKGFIPTTFNEIEITHETVSKTRILMQNTDKNISIVFATKRIDFVQELSSFDQNKQINPDLFYEEVLNLIDIFTTKYSDNKYIRLANTEEYIKKYFSVSDKKRIYNKFYSLLFNDENINDWALRVAKLNNFKDNKVNEVTTLETLTGKMGLKQDVIEIDGLKLSLDLNTDQTNQHEIYTANDVKEFIKYSLIKNKEIMTKVITTLEE